MKLIVLIALLKLVQTFWTPQFNQGHQVIVIFNTGHILETQSTVPRQVVIDIQFSIVFKFAPQVFIQPSRFKISGIAVAPSSLFELHFYWIAIIDPRILVITFETWEVQQLKTGSGQREVQYKIDHNLEDATNGIVSLIGIKHSAYSSTIEIDIAEITSQSITISARSYLQSQLEFIKLNVLLGTSQSLWSSPMQALINAANHPFVSRGEGDCDLQMTINRPQILGNYQLIPLIALRGYDINNVANIRLKYTNVALNTNIQFTLSTWSTSVIYRVYYQGAIFIYDPNYKAFDPYCAELFSECDFNGDTIMICDKVPDLQALGWSKPIRSMNIPKNRILFLFDMVNYKGVKQSVIQTQNAMNIQTFNLQISNQQFHIQKYSFSILSLQIIVQQLNSIVNAIIKGQCTKQLKDKIYYSQSKFLLKSCQLVLVLMSSQNQRPQIILEEQSKKLLLPNHV